MTCNEAANQLLAILNRKKNNLANIENQDKTLGRLKTNKYIVYSVCVKNKYNY